MATIKKQTELLHINDDSGTLFFCAMRFHADLTQPNSSHSQLSYNIERNIVK